MNPLRQRDIHTAPTCPHCGRTKSSPATPTCQFCWKNLPIPLRTALLKHRNYRGHITDLPSYTTAYERILTHLSTHPPTRD